MADNQTPSSPSRREGRARACEGLLASHFGRRTSQAGAKALAQLRTADQPGSVRLRDWEGTTPPAAANLIRFPQGVDSENESGRSGRGASWTWVAVAACCALLAGGVLFLAVPRLDAWQASLSVQGADVVVERGSQNIAAATGFRLRAGDTIQVPRGGAATIRFRRESTRIDLAESSALKLMAAGNRRRLELQRGRIEVVAAPQPPAHPLVFVTPEAEARVIGTHFFLAARQTSTWLAVIDGTVELARPSDKTATKVGPRHYAVAAPGLELAAQPEYQRWQTPYYLARPGAVKNAS